ncbi:MAG: helix-turn-helix domain-containing protein [Streptosporangiaceae bacterium]
MPAARALDPGASPSAFFGAELRHYRTRAGLSQEQLGERINYSGALVGAVETADRRPQLDFARRCDEALGTDGALTRLMVTVSREAFPGWFRPWLEVEQEATCLRGFEPLLVHGWFQTGDYAREVLRAGQPGASDEQVDEMVTARLERQEAILARDDPPMIYAVLDEGALHRPVGNPKVMAGQLGHLADAAQSPRVTLQVVPFAVGAHAGSGPLILATLRDAPDVAYLDTVVEGYLVDDPKIVATVSGLWEALRGDALPQQASVEATEKAARQWI